VFARVCVFYVCVKYLSANESQSLHIGMCVCGCACVRVCVCVCFVCV